MKQLLTEEQLAERIGVTGRCVRDWRSRKILPFLKIGRVVRFEADEVEAALRQYWRRTEAR